METNVTSNNKQYIVTSKLSLLIFGYVRCMTEDYVPSSIKKLILSFYPNPRDGILRIKSNETRTLKSDHQYEFESITIESNGILTVNEWNPMNKTGGTLLMDVMFDIIIHENGCIDLNGNGYRGGRGFNYGESYNNTYNVSAGPSGNNNGGGGGSYIDNAGHGGYGTKGMNGKIKRKFITDTEYDGIGGDVYGGKYLTKLYLGSGGGGYDDDDFPFPTYYNGGNGGGALKLQCNQLILEKNGNIYCNGTKGDCSNAGSGSGGSIHLIVYTSIILNETAGIHAIGGKSHNDGYGGGDGRIRLQILSNNKITTQNLQCFNPRPFVG